MKYTYMIILLFLTGTMFSQEAILITKNEAISKALENNNSIKIVGEQVNKSKADYQQTIAVFLPNISASYTGITTTNPLMAFGSKLNQEVISQSDFNPQLLNNPNRTNNFTTKIEVQQPLINIDGLFQRKAAKAKFNINQSKQSYESESFLKANNNDIKKSTKINKNQQKSTKINEKQDKSKK